MIQLVPGELDSEIGLGHLRGQHFFQPLRSDLRVALPGAGQRNPVGHFAGKFQDLGQADRPLVGLGKMEPRGNLVPLSDNCGPGMAPACRLRAWASAISWRA